MALFADRLAKLAQLLGTDGVVADAGIVSTIARDSEVTTAANAAQAAAIAAAATDATTKANAAQAAAIASAATDATTKANAAAAASQPLDSDLTAFAGLAIASDKLPYGTGSHTLGLADFTAAGRALVDDAAASDQRTTLGLGTLATQSGTFSGTSSGTNTGDQTIPVGGTPAVVLGTANTAGTSPNFLRRDDTILAFDATTPVAVGTAAVGAATVASRRDHVHATGAGTPTTQAFGDAAATGSGPAAAMTDHKHAFPALGTGATNAAAGNDSRLSDSRAPSGSAGGGLTGTYPNPTVATNANLTGPVTSVGNATTIASVTKRVLIPLDTPDASGNGYPALSLNNGFSNVRRVVPAFTKSVDGTWEGAVRIPADYVSAGVVVCSFVANATSGAIRVQVSDAVVAVSVTEDTAYTAETAANTTVPGTAKQRFDISTTLTATLVANSTLNVKVARIGTNGGDTLAVDALLWECLLQYST